MDNIVTDPDLLEYLSKIYDITSRVVLPARERAIKRMEEMAALNRNGSSKSDSGTPAVLHNGQPPVCSGNNCDVPVRPTSGLPFTTLLSGNVDSSSISGVPKPTGEINFTSQ